MINKLYLNDPILDPDTDPYLSPLYASDEVNYKHVHIYIYT